MPSTAMKVSEDPRVVEVWDEGKDGKWAELVAGYCSNLGTHQLHERTWIELHESLAGVKECRCRDCLRDGARGMRFRVVTDRVRHDRSSG